MPKLGESVTEGTIEKWLVKPGDPITKYASLAEVNTDKVNAEIPSLFDGTIIELVAKEGETLAVGEIVCIIETEAASSASANGAVVPTITVDEVVATKTNERKSPTSAGGGRYSPAVLRLSQENNIDLARVEGSGREGRITRKDLVALIESGRMPIVEAIPKAQPVQLQSDEAIVTGDIEVPMTGVRRAIANHTLRSTQEIPHAWMMIEVDVTNLVAYRDSLKEDFKQREGFNLTYFAFFVKAVTQALKEFPIMNSTWNNEKIIQKKALNISIAVAKDDLLFVPVIKHADELTIKGIGSAIHDLASKARSGKLSSAEMQDGTFTVNNTGSFGSIQSMGIINHPQAAILQVESIVKRPVIMEGNMIGIRDMVNLCVSLDHRVLDGLIGGRFLARVKEILENISPENTPIY